jgi:ABC-type uncharacterized transport system permease subunit
MNTNNASFLKTLTCGFMALAITMIGSWSFVHSTAMARIGGGAPHLMLVQASNAAHLG